MVVFVVKVIFGWYVVYDGDRVMVLINSKVWFFVCDFLG